MPVLRVGHSPDADDAFMFYPLAKGIITVPGYEITHVLEEIQALNQRALKGELEVTAISAAVYPQVAQHYRIMPCGASVGRKYGPAVVSKKPLDARDLAGKRIAIPGQFTTAYMLLRIYMSKPFEPVFMSFDAVTEAVQQGKVDAGIFIHEGQIREREMGLHKVLDLGRWWFDDTGLPVPLGLDMVHRRLGDRLGRQVTRALHDAIVHSRTHEDDALDYALAFGRGIDRETGRKFVRMYVNQDTEDMGEDGRKALETLFARAAKKGIIKEAPPLDLVEI
ncbi:MAG: ABC transporter substrate-binding protein [SAR202 cluster bacterium]|nr:ABC transporter substrate-binding protein [SAR202 cluster bacterium]